MRYLVAGSVNSLLGLAVIMLCMKVFAMPPVAANATGFVVGFISSFFINRSYTFRKKVELLPGLALFLAVVLGAYAANIAMLLIATQWFGVNPYVAQILGVGAYVVLVFFGSSLFVFKEA